MPYSAEISRRSPSAFVILVDQSWSMSEPLGLDQSRSKADFVADVVNKWLQNLILRCAKATEVRRYFDVAVIGYGGAVSSILGGTTTSMHPISETADNPLRVEERRQKVDDGAGGVIEMPVKFPIWVEPRADGNTPMSEALRTTASLLSTWIEEHQESYPPTVVNITDGAATDGDPRTAAAAVRALSTSDGNVLLLNCHISGFGGQPILYPSSATGLPDPLASDLFEMSSALPERMVAAAQGYANVASGARGFGYQADAASLITFLDIGTQVKSVVVVSE